jgi:hypothetical protein
MSNVPKRRKGVKKPKAAKANKVKPKGTVPRGLTTQAVRSLVRSELDQERHRVDVGPAGRDFMNMCANPFADGEVASTVKTMLAPCPDFSGASTLMVALTTRITVSGAVSTAGLVSIVFNASTFNIVENNYGADPSDITDAPTTTQAIVAPPEKAFFESIRAYMLRWRCYAGGIKANVSSSIDNQGGWVLGYLGAGRIRTAAAAYNSYDNACIHKVDAMPRLLTGAKGGETLRMRPCETNLTWRTAATFPAQYGDLAGLTEVPHLAYLIDATTKFTVDATLIFEFEVWGDLCPLRLINVPREPEWELAVEYLCDGVHVPLSSGGHSLKSIWAVIKKVALTFFRVANVVGPVVEKVAKIL